MIKKISKSIYWIPRILAILLILFLMIFSLDVFELGLTGWQVVAAFFIHNLPSLILAIVLWISWKYEIVGGVVFIIAGVAHMIFLLVRADVEPWYISFLISLIIDVPAYLIGVLFLIGWFKKKEQWKPTEF